MVDQSLHNQTATPTTWNFQSLTLNNLVLAQIVNRVKASVSILALELVVTEEIDELSKVTQQLRRKSAAHRTGQLTASRRRNKKLFMKLLKDVCSSIPQAEYRLENQSFL